MSEDGTDGCYDALRRVVRRTLHAQTHKPTARETHESAGWRGTVRLLSTLWMFV